MKCPKCQKECLCRTLQKANTDNSEVYRRRQCVFCGSEFYTIEFEVEADETFKKEWDKYYKRPYKNAKKVEKTLKTDLKI